MSNIEDLQFQIFDSEGNESYAMNYMSEIVVAARREPKLQALLEKEKPAYDTKNFTNSWNWEALLEAYRETKSDFTKIGTYIIFWDGFDNQGIYDSKVFNKKTLTAKLIASKNGVTKVEEVSFSTAYAEVKWVDRKLIKTTKNIDKTLRIELKDSDENGILVISFNSIYTMLKDHLFYPWVVVSILQISEIKLVQIIAIKYRLKKLKTL